MAKFDLMTRDELLRLFPETEKLRPEQQEKLREYFTSVRFLSSWNTDADQLNMEFNNRDEYHAAIVMSTLFDCAESVQIFAGDFNGDVCSKSIYLGSLERNFRSGNKKLTVVFENEPTTNSEGYKKLKSLQHDFPEKIQIKRLSESFLVNVKKANSKGLSHFAVGDGKMYRYEVDTTSYKALCNFDDEDTAITLSNNFILLEANAMIV